MIDYKFKDLEILEELKEYIDKTYSEHYAKGDDEIQAFQIMMKGTSPRALYFAVMSCLKYSDRFGEKEGMNRKDLFKIAHFALLAICALDKYNSKEKERNEVK